MKNLIGEASCQICQESFSTTIDGMFYMFILLNTLFSILKILQQSSWSCALSLYAALTEPIDVYSEWIDECERVNALEDEDA